MKTVKQIALTALLFVSFTGIAQQKNELIDRKFWKSNPDVATIKQKIAEGNDPAEMDSNSFDATTLAITSKADTEVVKYLLSLEGNAVDKKTHDSRIYLHWAAYAGDAELVQFLLDNGASVTALDSHRYTPLAFGVNAGLTNPAIYNAFEKKGVNLVEEKNEHGANVLLLAAPSLKTEKELNFFLDKGLSLDSNDEDGNGIFNYASKKGNIDFLNLLIKKGVDYKSLNDNGGNAFMFASQGGRGFSNGLPVYTYLKGLGLEPNIVEKNGSTPLHRLAFGTKDAAIIELFLNAGADVNQADEEGNTPFLNAAARNQLSIVQLLAKNVKDINAANKSGETALMLATHSNKADVVEFLISKGADINAQDTAGNTAAYFLADSYNKRNAKAFDAKLALLKSKGLKFNTVQGEGNTLYHVAAKKNNLELLKKVSDFNIDVNAKNDEGLTALHVAAMKAENDKLLKFLLAKGADAKSTTDFEETVYDLASENELLQKENTSLNFLKQ
ncbi:ankyrin repeat domain-containing protein [Maribacter sp. 1_MG-2023]|uniref:ankyrin repeat domain-containing protein n=1 Tax=Maribacter sp. 1_MG-2023 TaxID=3062677 RepID=UPI0026E1FDC0|nr:ankyrin repeat domain-containing protein [Maribacter sp. 1_MG-2023]MDO6471853.1 ankyrin repeat domain-containing protein [Maribacter sp. 1_MG-2023]